MPDTDTKDTTLDPTSSDTEPTPTPTNTDSTPAPKTFHIIPAEHNSPQAWTGHSWINLRMTRTVLRQQEG